MKSITVTVQDKEGLHARPAGIINKAAKECACAVTMEKDGKTADMKRMFAIMGLGVKGGDVITISCDGADEETAIETMTKLFETI